MNLLARLREWYGDRDWVQSAMGLAAVIGIGVVIGYQYMLPDKRVLGAAAALILFGIAWRIDLVSGLGVLLLAIPFPRHTTFGSTNLAFILLLLVVWMLRYTQRQVQAPRRTPLDAPLAGMLLAYVISFYNVDSMLALERSITIFMLFISCVLMFYLVVNNVRTAKDLRRLHLFQTASTGVIYAFCLWELAFPGHQLIPGWIDLSDMNIALAQAGRYRVGGPWTDFELLSEFAAMNVVFFLFLVAQAGSASRRVIFSTFLFASVFILFATVTRGGITSLAVGLVYLLFLIRRRVNFVPLTIIGGAATALVIGLNVFMKSFTLAGDVFSRFEETHFVGMLPDSRAEVWPQAWARWMQHPLLGHGPYYSSVRGLKLWYWPHNLPLFIGNCFGFFGLAMFVWVMWSFWKLSRPRTDRLNDPDYLKAFQLVARVQLVIFFVDEMKIEYLRNPNYQFLPWVFFSTLAAAGMILMGARAAEQVSNSRLVPSPAPARA